MIWMVKLLIYILKFKIFQKVLKKYKEHLLQVYTTVFTIFNMDVIASYLSNYKL